MPALLIVNETITEPELFEEYKRAVVPTLEKFGGRFLARGAALEVLETSGTWAPDRLVIVEFPDMAALKAWYESPEYAPAREIRFRSAASTLVAMETTPISQ
ncbi:DUF1330 domain-containing protein [Yoonia sediminilitoris]|uniref:Uncharacterized protein (DUF1330 family) n=1 Tax=Yoonia sediminilitoris TaxID=1286148 RepID=A0A2T6KBV1_9RHOB|nr:DUF1330 domain-containing protein [Yoonia sediminilitoris]PUB12390.1 uncharacterized protein (DUF1330 family) [Yoonia sediminilitoris]RCW93084.1 uncharacterized protein (DUF1330 family) [Yoonia sediminilitoris]